MQSHPLFRPLPGLISGAGVTGRWGLLSHAQNAVRAGLVQKVGGDSSKAPCLCTDVLRAAIVCSERNC